MPKLHSGQLLLVGSAAVPGVWAAPGGGGGPVAEAWTAGGDIAAQSERVEALNAAALRFSQLQGESGVEDWGGDFQGLC